MKQTSLTWKTKLVITSHKLNFLHLNILIITLIYTHTTNTHTLPNLSALSVSHILQSTGSHSALFWAALFMLATMLPHLEISHNLATGIVLEHFS